MRDLGGLEQRLLGPAQEIVERRLAGERPSQRPEMQRQEQRQQKPRDAVDQERPVRRVVAVAPAGRSHSTTAATARMPMTNSATPTTSQQASAPRPRQCSHSAPIVRNPIGAWIATAATNTA